MDGGTDLYFRNFSIFTPRPITQRESWRNLFTNENESITNTFIRGRENAKNYSIYLLVDCKVFSAAEKFAKLCKQNGFATIVGSATMGEGNGLTPLRLQISDMTYQSKNNTVNGISIRFPIEAPINELGKIDYEHFYNTIPDIHCSSDKALETAMSIINKNKRKGNGALNCYDLLFQEKI